MEVSIETVRTSLEVLLYAFDRAKKNRETDLRLHTLRQAVIELEGLVLKFPNLTVDRKQ